MHVFGYIAIGFLIVCILLAATKSLSVGSPVAIAVADVAQVVTPDTTLSPRQPIAGPTLQHQNQTDSAQERLQETAEEEQDLLNTLD